MAPSLVFLVMVVLAMLLLYEAMRRGLGRMMAALAFMGAWLALTASASRATNQVQAGEAARNYAVVMAALSFLYFRVKARPANTAIPLPHQAPPSEEPELTATYSSEKDQESP